MVSVLWTNPSPQTVGGGTGNGRLLTLNFTYHGLTSPLAFVPAYCEVTRLVGSMPVILTGSFTDGSVSPFAGNAAQAHIGTVSAPLGTVSVPVTYSGFPTNVGSMTQKIAYDAGKLTYISVSGTGNLATGFNANVSAGIITITWTSPVGKDINASQFNLNFMYNTLANAPVTFSTGCVVTTTPSPANVPVTYNNGAVIPPPVITSYATLPTITNAVQGQIVDVPLTFTDMPSGVTNFNVNLTYDNPRMSFVSYHNAMYPVTLNASGNSISISYTNAGGPAINGQFLTLRFMYNGVGTANIHFAPGCQFSTGSPVGVGYTDGIISPAPAVVNATVGSVAGSSPSQVAVPVTFSDIPSGTNIGAVTMNIAFDASKLTYVNAVNPFGAQVDLNGNVLNIAWTTTVPTSLNGIPFITLNFNYAASGNATAFITFADGCQLADLANPHPVIPANWNDGGVNTLFKLFGNLSYYMVPGVPLENATIQIKDGPEPVPPAVTPVPNVLYTVNANAAGYFEIFLPNGTYYLYATCPMPWGGVDGGDVTQIRRKIALLTNVIDGHALRMRAADVSMDGEIDGTDVTALRRRIALLTPNPNYKAPDWIFDNPQIIMNGSDVNQNFNGICSGDVNSTYPN